MVCAVRVEKELLVILGGYKLFEIHSLSLLSCEPLEMQHALALCVKKCTF